MSKYKEKLAEAHRLAKERLAVEAVIEEINDHLLSKIIVKIAVERPTKFAMPETLAEEALRRYRLSTNTGRYIRAG